MSVKVCVSHTTRAASPHVQALKKKTGKKPHAVMHPLSPLAASLRLHLDLHMGPSLRLKRCRHQRKAWPKHEAPTVVMHKALNQGCMQAMRQASNDSAGL